MAFSQVYCSKNVPAEIPGIQERTNCQKVQDTDSVKYTLTKKFIDLVEYQSSSLRPEEMEGYYNEYSKNIVNKVLERKVMYDTYGQCGPVFDGGDRDSGFSASSMRHDRMVLPLNELVTNRDEDKDSVYSAASTRPRRNLPSTSRFNNNRIENRDDIYSTQSTRFIGNVVSQGGYTSNRGECKDSVCSGQSIRSVRDFIRPSVPVANFADEGCSNGPNNRRFVVDNCIPSTSQNSIRNVVVDNGNQRKQPRRNNCVSSTAQSGIRNVVVDNGNQRKQPRKNNCVSSTAQSSIRNVVVDHGNQQQSTVQENLNESVASRTRNAHRRLQHLQQIVGDRSQKNGVKRDNNNAKEKAPVVNKKSRKPTTAESYSNRNSSFVSSTPMAASTIVSNRIPAVANDSDWEVESDGFDFDDIRVF